VAAFLGGEKETVRLGTRMTSEEPSRLGIHHLLANGDVADWSISAAGLALEIEFNRFLEIRRRLFAGGTEAGHVHVEALADEELIFRYTQAIAFIGERLPRADDARNEPLARRTVTRWFSSESVV
jgi:hypothetical protein